MRYILTKDVSIEVVIDAYDKEEAIQQFEEATVGIGESLNNLEDNFYSNIDEDDVICKPLVEHIRDKMEDDDGF